MSNSLQSHRLQHARLLCPPLSPWVHSDSCWLSQWYYLTISFSTAPFSFCLQYFPESVSFPVSHLFTLNGKSIAVYAPATIFPVNIEGCFPLRLTGLISLPSSLHHHNLKTSVLPMNIQGWLPLALTGLISLLSKGLSRVYPSTTIQSINSSALSPLYGPTLTSLHDYWKNHSFEHTDFCWQSDVFAF